MRRTAAERRQLTQADAELALQVLAAETAESSVPVGLGTRFATGAAGERSAGRPADTNAGSSVADRHPAIARTCRSLAGNLLMMTLHVVRSVARAAQCRTGGQDTGSSLLLIISRHKINSIYPDTQKFKRT